MSDILLYVYKNFKIIGTIENFIGLEWVRKYNDVGNFSIDIPISENTNINLFAVGNVIYKKDIKESMVIEDISITRDMNDREVLNVKGRSLSSFLDRRICSYTGKDTVRQIVLNIVNNNFITSKNENRNIPNFRAFAGIMETDIVDVEFKNSSVLEIIKLLCQSYGLGFKIDYNKKNESYDFLLYKGKETNALFTNAYNNILSEEYYNLTSGEKTTVYLEYDDDSVYIHNNTRKALNRKEIYASNKVEDGESIIGQAKSVLLNHSKLQSMDLEINTLSEQYVYRKDWNLGDICRCTNKKWKADIKRNILEITEFYDLNGFHLTVIFGDYIKSSGSSGSSGTANIIGSSGGVASIKYESDPKNIKMDGVTSVGSLNTVARSNHVHPTDITRAPVDHASRDPDYGLATPNDYGHVKFANNTETKGELLASPYQYVKGGKIDLNEYRENCSYTFYDIETAVNFPSGKWIESDNASYLDVKKFYDTEAVYQTLYKRNTREIWIRYLDNNEWSKWRELIDFETNPKNIKMDDVASVGSLDTIARSDHVHPTDITRAPVDHASSNDTYGLATSDKYGHVKFANNTVTSSELMVIPYQCVNGVDIDLNDYKSNGYFTFCNITAVTNFPPGVWYTYSFLEVKELYGSTIILQILYTRANTDIWIRYYISDFPWRPWRKIASIGENEVLVPTNHASTSNTYGLGSPSSYGHVKFATNVLGTSEYVAMPYRCVTGGTIILNNYTNIGFFAFNNISTATNFPTGTWTGPSNNSHLEVKGLYSNSAVLQILYKRSTTDIWIRYSTNTTSWSTWRKIPSIGENDVLVPTNHASSATTYGIGSASSYGHVKFANNTVTTNEYMAMPYQFINGGTIDLNSYRNNGFFTFYNLTTATNFPSGTWTSSGNSSFLEVKRFYSNIAVLQTIYKRSTNEVWIRYCTSSTSWSQWNRLLFESNNQTASTTTPLMDGTATAGSNIAKFAQEGHRHPTDTSRAQMNHSSTSTTYGIGTSSSYGHVKFANNTVTSNEYMAMPYQYIGSGTVILNNYTSNGFFTFYNISTATNFPSGTWTGSYSSYLEVKRLYSNTAIRQVLYKSGSNEVWTRYSTSTTSWSSWVSMLYTHPSTHPATMIVQDSNNRFVTDTERNAWVKRTVKSSQDLNTLRTVGFYNGTFSNRPSGATSSYGSVIVQHTDNSSTSYVNQIYINENANPSIWLRGSTSSSTWGAWQNLTGGSSDFDAFKKSSPDFTGTPAIKVNGAPISFSDITKSLYVGTKTNNKDASYVTAVGFEALNSNQSNQNTAVGYRALYSNINANNTAIGYCSLWGNTGGDSNVALGHCSAHMNTTGSKNTALGFEALYNNLTHNSSTAVGYEALYYSRANGNTAVGYQALKGRTTSYSTAGAYNTAVGYLALYGNSSGNYNTAIGGYSGSTASYGNSINSVYIGYKSRTNAESQTNQIVIGYEAVGGGSNTITLGNSSITKLRCQVTTITSLSDSRVKEDIKPANLDLCYNAVRDLPVHRYKYKDFTGKHLDKHVTGFMADNVEKVFPKSVTKSDQFFKVLDENGNEIEEEVEINGETSTETKMFEMKDVKEITMTEAIPTLWGAVQKMMEKIEYLEKENIELKNQISSFFNGKE